MAWNCRRLGCRWWRCRFRNRRRLCCVEGWRRSRGVFDFAFQMENDHRPGFCQTDSVARIEPTLAPRHAVAHLKKPLAVRLDHPLARHPLDPGMAGLNIFVGQHHVALSISADGHGLRLENDRLPRRHFDCERHDCLSYLLARCPGQGGRGGGSSWSVLVGSGGGSSSSTISGSGGGSSSNWSVIAGTGGGSSADS